MHHNYMMVTMFGICTDHVVEYNVVSYDVAIFPGLHDSGG